MEIPCLSLKGKFIFFQRRSNDLSTTDSPQEESSSNPVYILRHASSILRHTPYILRRVSYILQYASVASEPSYV